MAFPSGYVCGDITNDSCPHYGDNSIGSIKNISDNNLSTSINNFTYAAINFAFEKNATLFRLHIPSGASYTNIATGKLQGSINSTDGTDGDWYDLIDLSTDMEAPSTYPGWTNYMDIQYVLLETDRYNTSDQALGVYYDGNFVYVADDDDGLSSYSVDADGNITRIDHDDQGGRARKVFASGGFVYLANYDRGIDVYSVDNDGYLTHTDNNDQGNYCWNALKDTDFLFSAHGTVGVYSYSVSSSGTISVIDNVINGDVRDIAKDKNFLYSISDAAIIRTYSVDASGYLALIDDTVDAGSYGRGIEVYNGYLYVACNAGVNYYSVDPSGYVSYVGNVNPGRCMTVSAYKDKLYTTSLNNGTYVYSISSSGTLTQDPSYYPTNDRARDAMADDNFVYVADEAYGFVVLSIQDTWDWYRLTDITGGSDTTLNEWEIIECHSSGLIYDPNSKWWNEDWNNRYKLCMYGGDAYTSGVHYFKLNIDLNSFIDSNLLLPNYADVRIVYQDADGEVNLPYSIASGADRQIIYFPTFNNIEYGITPSSLGKYWDYYFYYGNPDSSNTNKPEKYSNLNFPQAPYAAQSGWAIYTSGNYKDKFLYPLNGDPSVGDINVFEDLTDNTTGDASIGSTIIKGQSGIIDQAVFMPNVSGSYIDVSGVVDEYVTYPSGNWCLDLWIKPSGNFDDNNWFFVSSEDGNNKKLAIGHSGSYIKIYYTPGVSDTEQSWSGDVGIASGEWQHLRFCTHITNNVDTLDIYRNGSLSGQTDSFGPYEAFSITEKDNKDQGYGIQPWANESGIVFSADRNSGFNVYRLGDDGSLTLADNDSTGSYSWGCFGTTNRNLVFACQEQTVRSYSYDSSGNLTFVDDASFSRARKCWYRDDDDLLFVSDSTNGNIRVFSVDSSGYMTETDSYDCGTSSYRIFGFNTGVSGIVFCAAGTDGIFSFTCDGSGNLLNVDSDDQGGDYRGVWGKWYPSIGSGVLFTTARDPGVHSYLVDEYGQLTFVQTIDNGRPQDVWGDENYIYTAEYNGGIRIYKYYSDATFSLETTESEPQHTFGVFRRGNYLFSSNYYEGTYSYEINTGKPQNAAVGGATSFQSENNFVGYIEQCRFSTYPFFGAEPAWINVPINIELCSSSGLFGPDDNVDETGGVIYTRYDFPEENDEIGGILYTNTEFQQSGIVGVILNSTAIPASGEIGGYFYCRASEDILTIGGYLLTFETEEREKEVGGAINVLAGAPSEEIGCFSLSTWAETDYTCVENLSRVLIKGNDRIVPRQEMGMEAKYTLYNEKGKDANAEITVLRTKNNNFDSLMNVQKKHRVPYVKIINTSVSGQTVMLTASGIAYDRNNQPIVSGLKDAMFTWTDGNIDIVNGVMETCILSHTYAKSGLYKPSVKISDRYGEYGSDFVNINLASGLSLPGISLSGAPREGTPTLYVDFDVSLSGVVGTYDIYWDYNNGLRQYNNALSTSSQYAMPGDYCPHIRLENKNVYIVDTLKIGFNR